MGEHFGFDQMELPAAKVRPVPLAIPAAAVTAAIAFARWIPLSSAVWLAGIIVSGTATGVSLILHRKPLQKILFRVSFGLLCVNLAFLAGYRFVQDYKHYPADHIAQYLTDQPQLISLQGTIITPPRLYKSRGGMADSDFLHTPRTLFTLRCERVLMDTGWENASGEIAVTVKRPALNLMLGQTLRIDGTLLSRFKPDNPGEFDFSEWYRRERLPAACSVEYPEAIQLVESIPTWSDRVLSFRYGLQKKTLQALTIGITQISTDSFSNIIDPSVYTDETQSFLAALILGQRETVSRPMMEAFVRTGTLHVLSVSGFHVGVWAGFIWCICRLLQWKRTVAGIAALLAIVFYIFIVPSQPPVIRSGVVCIVFCAGYLFRRPAQPLNTLCFSAILLLLASPMDLFNSGFQLSFLMVLCLVVFEPAVRHSLYAMFSRDIPRLKYIDDMPHPLLHRLGRYTLRTVVQLILVTCIAWLVSLPLIAWHFNRISLWAIPASVILTPVISLLLIAGFVKLWLSLLVPAMGIWIAWPIEQSSKFILSLTQFFSDLPMTILNTASPPLWILMFFYLFLTIAAVWIHFRNKLPQGFFSAAAFWILLFALLFPIQPRFRKEGNASIAALSVGHGCAVIVQLSDKKIVAYDAGSLGDFDMANRVILPYLRSQGIQKIDALFLSHPNIDHYNAVPDLCGNVPIGQIFLSPAFFEEPAASKRAIHSLLESIQKHNVPMRVIHRDSEIHALSDSSHSPPDYTLNLLWPASNASLSNTSENDMSLILKIQDRNGSLLLCGDAGIIPQKTLLQTDSPEQLKSDILLLPHHGSLRSLYADFAQTVQPKVCLNTSGRIEIKTRKSLSNILSRAAVYYTSLSGAITVILNPNGPEVIPFHSVETASSDP